MMSSLILYFSEVFSLPVSLNLRRTKALHELGEKVTLEIGNTFTYTTEKKYRGDVKVQVELEHTKKSAKVTVKKGTDTAKFNFENIENLLGDDD